MNKTAIVTGASRGIGFAISELLLNNGYNCVLTARNINDNLSTLAEKYANRCLIIACDISVSGQRETLVNTVKAKFGEIDLLVNNAGVAPKNRKDMLEITEEDFDYVLDINLKGTFFLTQAISKIIKKGGKIINISSVSAETVSLNRAEYCIAKSGISMLTKLFAVRLAECGVAVFELRPGVIDTDMIEQVKSKYEAMAECGVIPACRLGTPQDVANIVYSLTQGAFDYATGSVIECGGGLHIKTL